MTGITDVAESLSDSEIRSFMDLRALTDSQLTAGADLSGDAFLSARRVIRGCPRQVSIGVIDLPAGAGEIADFPNDEFIIVDTGSITLRDQDRTVTLDDGGSAVLRRGADFRWQCDRPTRLIFMRHIAAGHVQGGFVPIDTAAALAPSGAPLAELLVGPTPQCRNHTDFRSEDGEFTCGTWDSTPYHRRPMRYGHYELMHLLEGSVTFVDGASREATFAEGDIFLVEQGATCSWNSAAHVKKVYAIYRPV